MSYNLQLSGEQVQLLLNAQTAKIEELEDKIKFTLACEDFENRAKHAFQEFIESLGTGKQVECVRFIYEKYGACDFTKDTLMFWHDESIDLTNIECSKADFVPWPTE